MGNWAEMYLRMLQEWAKPEAKRLLELPDPEREKELEAIDQAARQRHREILNELGNEPANRVVARELVEDELKTQAASLATTSASSPESLETLSSAAL